MTPVVDKEGKPLPVAEKTLIERNTDPKFPEGGGQMPGVTSNAGTEAGGATAPSAINQAAGAIAGAIKTGSLDGKVSGAMATNDKETAQKTMNFNNEEKLVTPAIGAIERLSASVTYQYGMPKVGGEAEAEPVEGGPKKLTEEEVSKIVKDAIGYVEGRDSMTVKEVVFDSTLQDMLKDQLAKADAAKKQIAWWWALVAGLVALVVGAGIGGALLGKKAPPPEAAGGFGGIPGAGDYAAIPGAPPGGAIPAPE
jgi:flagellar biosynthesis/type III secretory pathway M-ring protein FliF/YscJ